MGALFSKSKYKKKLSTVSTSLDKARKNVEILKMENNIKMDEINKLREALKDINHTLNRYNEMLNKPKILARAILNSDIVKGSGDDTDIEYLVSVINFINVACND